MVIPEQRKGGFSTRLDCFDYGVYPSVRGWHGGCWDITAVSPEELASEISGFVDSILNDAILEIRYSNMKAYKWLLNYQIKGSRAREETGLLLFNWFGSRSVQRFTSMSSGYSSLLVLYQCPMLVLNSALLV